MRKKAGQYNFAFENTELPTLSVIQLPGDEFRNQRTKFTHGDELRNQEKKITPDDHPPPPDYNIAITQDETPPRDQWNNQIEFLLSCISMSVGLGNVWRFPFTAFENGGGAFLIPYLIVLMLIGKPLYFMELALGQFSSYGAVKVWKCVPILKGIGFSQAISTFYVTTYYNALMATCVFYIAACFQKVLPWTVCASEWGSSCSDSLMEVKGNFSKNCNEATTVAGVNITVNTTTPCLTDENTTKIQSAAELYYTKYVLQMSQGIDSMTAPDWRLALCLLFCWITVFFCLIRGVKSSGKTTYFTAVFPYVVLITLVILGSTLNGALEGVLYFVKPDWNALLDGKVWYAACEQSFFSLAVGFGNLTMFSSYNPFRHNVYKDALIVSVLDTLTSLLAGFAIFAILGSMAYNLDLPIKDVVESGAGLAFIAYPQALAEITIVPQLWPVLFFLMLFTLGIGSSVSQVGNVLTIFCDEMPKVAKWKICLVISVLCYFIGLLYITQPGQYILKLVDSYGAGFTVFIYAVLQSIAIMWIYGIRNFCKDVEFMLGRKMSYYWKICWAFVVPVALSAIFVFSIVTHKPPTLGKYVYPNWCIAVGWAISGLAILQIPIWAAITVYQQKGATILEKIVNSFQPASDWGPRNAKDRLEWLQFK